MGNSQVTECLCSVCKAWFNPQYRKEGRRREEKDDRGRREREKERK